MASHTDKSLCFSTLNNVSTCSWCGEGFRDPSYRSRHFRQCPKLPAHENIDFRTKPAQPKARSPRKPRKTPTTKVDSASVLGTQYPSISAAGPSSITPSSSSWFSKGSNVLPSSEHYADRNYPDVTYSRPTFHPYTPSWAPDTPVHAEPVTVLGYQSLADLAEPFALVETPFSCFCDGDDIALDTALRQVYPLPSIASRWPLTSGFGTGSGTAVDLPPRQEHAYYALQPPHESFVGPSSFDYVH